MIKLDFLASSEMFGLISFIFICLCGALIHWIARFLSPKHLLWRSLWIVCCLLLALRYSYWRYTATLPELSINALSIYQWLFFIIEIIVLLFRIKYLIILLRQGEQQDLINAYATETSLVDILIPSYNEDIGVLKRTLAGALGIEGARTRIWLLDDGCREWVKSLCRDWGVFYIERRSSLGAKAGNINHGLKTINQLDEKSDFIAIFDADFVPHANFLQRTLPLFNKPSVGIVQTPQNFFSDGPIQFNLCAADIWPEEQTIQYDVILPARNAWGTAYCCGTSWIIRKEALDEIKELPIISVTEDYLTSLELKERGWETVYLNERLSQGLAPAGISEYVSQRCRWAQGTSQIFLHKFKIFGVSKLRFLESFHLLFHIGHWLIFMPYGLILLIIPSIYWFTGMFIMQTSLASFLSYWLVFYMALALFFAWISHGRNFLFLINHMAQIIPATNAYIAALTGLIKPKLTRFHVTAKDVSRHQWVVHKRLLFGYLSLLGLDILGVVLVFFTPYGDHYNVETNYIVLMLTLYNILLLGLLSLVCLERPRRRYEERFTSSSEESLKIKTSALNLPVQLKDISMSGACFRSTAPFTVGEQLELEIDGVGLVKSQVVRVTGPICAAGKGTFIENGHSINSYVAVAFNLSTLQFQKLVKKIYSNNYNPQPQRYSLFKIAKTIGQYSLSDTFVKGNRYKP